MLMNAPEDYAKRVKEYVARYATREALDREEVSTSSSPSLTYPQPSQPPSRPTAFWVVFVVCFDC
jgi:hypothetical protein